MAQLKRLFEPIKIGNLYLRNRVWFLPVTTEYSRDGQITDRASNFYLERALGGVGMVTFGFMTPVNYQGSNMVGEAIHSDKYVNSLARFTNEIHKTGSKIIAQLCLRHQWRRSETAPLEYVAPTGGIVTGPGISSPRELTLPEIEQIVEEFGDAARRSREAGFDAVEFHCGLGYLVNRFISPATNKRTDRYGGSLENRLRFILEILQNTQRKTGRDFPLVCRLSAEEYMPGGHTVEDSEQVARLLVKAGVVAINVQAGWLESPQPLIQSSVPPGAYVHLAERIKAAVNVPVVAAYRINNALLAEQILEHGQADLIGMCRALIADPHLVNKARDERFDEIRPCIACCHCLDLTLKGNPMECTVNPWAGREAKYHLKPAAHPKSVLVVGGGPGGMQAAIVAAERGHKVSLFDENPVLGGQLTVASVPPFKTEIAALNRYLKGALRRLTVRVCLGTKVTLDLILSEKPDVTIVATGAIPSKLDIPGIDGSNVVDPISVLKGSTSVGQRVVVVGGGLIGCEAAEFLAARGKQVTITTRQSRVGHDMGASTRWVVKKRLEESGVSIRCGMTPVKISGKGVQYFASAVSEFLEADTVVVAGGMRSDNELLRACQGKIERLYSIGDCVRPGKIKEALDDAVRIALDI